MTDLAELRLKALRLQALAMQSKAAPQENIIATTPDGGRVTRGADGVMSFASPGYSTNDPAKIAEIMKGATPAQITQEGFDQSTIAQHPIAARASKVVQGFPIAGAWADEALGMVAPKAGEAMANTQRAMDRQHFGQSLALQIAGAAPAMLAPGAVPSWLTGGGSLMGQTLAGSALGLGMGAAQGAGDAPDGKRMQGAVSGGMFGAAAGAVAPWVAGAFRKGSERVIAYLRNTDIAGIKSALGVNDKAATVIKAHLQNSDTKAAIAAMDRAGPEAMIADSSPEASQLLDTAIQAGGPAQQIARTAVEGRAAQTATNLNTAMDTILGPAQGVKASARDIATKTAAARKSAYDAAYAAPINYASDEGRAIEAVIARVPTGTLQTAIKEANDAMKEAGIKNLQIMAEIGKDGAVTFREMPNVQQLDFLKRALGNVADGAKDNFGRYTAEGVRANRLAGDLRDAIGNAVPTYRSAVKLGGDKIAEDKALEIGRKFMQPSLTREDVAAAMQNASVEARLAAKRGMRAAFDEAMANVKAVASDPNIDARQAYTAAREFSSAANRAKAEAILGKAHAAQLFAEFDKASTQLALRTAVSRNSATAARTAGKQAIDSIIDSPVEAFKRGEVAKGARGIIQIMTRATPADRLQKEQAIYAEIARALTDQRGAQAKQALQIVQQAIAGTPATKADAAFVARALTTALAGGAYHTSQRLRTSASGGMLPPQ